MSKERRKHSPAFKAKVALEAAAHLAANLERVTVLVLATVWSVHDGGGRPGLSHAVSDPAKQEVRSNWRRQLFSVRASLGWMGRHHTKLCDELFNADHFALNV